MTVEQLIAELQRFHPRTIVRVDVGCCEDEQRDVASLVPDEEGSQFLAIIYMK